MIFPPIKHRSLTNLVYLGTTSISIEPILLSLFLLIYIRPFIIMCMLSSAFNTLGGRLRFCSSVIYSYQQASGLRNVISENGRGFLLKSSISCLWVSWFIVRLLIIFTFQSFFWSVLWFTLPSIWTVFQSMTVLQYSTVWLWEW